VSGYGSDRAAWADRQASLLRERRAPAIDKENIAGIIENLGTADVEQLRDRIRILLTALLRWAYEVDLRSVALNVTIGRQRDQIERLLEDSPSLVPTARTLVVEVYPEARRAAAMEAGPFEDAFPAGLPFLPSEVLDDSFLPDPYGDDAIRGAEWWRHR
jgi:hypothetical protein